MAASEVGHINKKALFDALPDQLILKRGSNARLFVQTPLGALMMNNRQGQTLLETKGELSERELPAPVAPPQAASEPTPAPAPAPEPEPEPKQQEEEETKKGFFESFFD